MRMAVMAAGAVGGYFGGRMAAIRMVDLIVLRPALMTPAPA